MGIIMCDLKGQIDKGGHYKGQIIRCTRGHYDVEIKLNGHRGHYHFHIKRAFG